MRPASAIPSPRVELDPAESWALVVRAQAGDMDAFADLYRRYHDQIIRFIYRRVSDWPLAEDLAGDVWFKALRKLGDVEWLGIDFGAWLSTIARNLVNDHYKSARHRFEFPSDDLDLNHVHDKPTERLERAELRALLNEAIGLLTPEQAAVIRLRYFDCLSEAETAARLGVDVKTMKSRAYRGRQAILRYARDLLEAHR